MKKQVDKLNDENKELKEKVILKFLRDLVKCYECVVVVQD